MILSDRLKHQLIIANARAEVAARLGVVQTEFEVKDTLLVMQELDKIIESVRLIKRAILFLKNTR